MSEASDLGCIRRPAAERSEGALPWRLAHKNEVLVSNSTDDLPPSRARGRYHGGLLTKSKRVGTRQKRKSKIWRVRSHCRRHPKDYKMKFSVNQLT